MLVAIATTFVLGLRHGVDWDHIAAIGDLAGSQTDKRRAMRSATLYAAGHAAVVFVLGTAALAFGELLPPSIDGVMERVVGLTLLLLAGFIVVGLVRDGRDFRMRSSWMLLLAAARRVRNRSAEVVIEHEHEHDHAGDHDHGHGHRHDAADHNHPRAPVLVGHRHRHVHRGELPADPFTPTSQAALAIGALHGIGAETGTQALLLIAAAEAGGVVAGEAVLLAFVVGLLASNTAIAAVSTYGFLRAGANFRIYVTVAVLTVAFSAVTGALFLLGMGGSLPAIL